MAADLPLHRSSDSGGDLDGSGCTISCSDCRLEGTSACDDCVVTYLLGPDVAEAIDRHPSSRRAPAALRVVGGRAGSDEPVHRAEGDGPELRPMTEVRLDAREAEVLRLFQDAGLAPASRHVRRVG